LLDTDERPVHVCSSARANTSIDWPFCRIGVLGGEAFLERRIRRVEAVPLEVDPAIATYAGTTCSTRVSRDDLPWSIRAVIRGGGSPAKDPAAT
jgi:hypothetical protein